MDEYYEKAYQEWLENYDQNNLYDLHVRGLISDDDLHSWLEKKERQEKFNKRKRIAEIICKEHKN
jgi:hypothetical protein